MWLGDVPSPPPCAVPGPLPATVLCWAQEQWPSTGTMGAVSHRSVVAAARRCPPCPRLGAGCSQRCRVPRGTGPLSLALVWKLRDLLTPAAPAVRSRIGCSGNNAKCQPLSGMVGTVGTAGRGDAEPVQGLRAALGRRETSGCRPRALPCPRSGSGCLGGTSKRRAGTPGSPLGSLRASVYPSVRKGPALSLPGSPGAPHPRAKVTPFPRRPPPAPASSQKGLRKEARK